jgi:serine/threonine protein kinase
MAATLTTEQFLDALRKSKLVDEKRLDAFQQSASGSMPDNSRDLAQQLVRQGLLTPWQINQLLAGKWKGFLLAGEKYKLMDRLGAGGMGQVFLCEHRRMKRLVALKVLPTDKIKDDQSALERFDREARAAAALDHPNIVRAHDIDSDGKFHFLVMEFVDGTSLQEMIKKHGPLDIIRACHYIADAARGLQHAHEAGWVHRDIKPGNLLLDRTGTLKILDMGLARLFTDDTDNLTKRYEKDAVLGTADYLAPEQATHSSDVDVRADIYSLGATFYYLLTGRSPFDDGTVTQKLIWHQTRQPDSLRALRPEIPKELETVIAKMMAKKPVHRYQEPSAIIAALEPWTSTPVEPPADEEMPRLCPALSTYSAVGASLPLSALAGPPSTVRGRSRGPRTTKSSNKSLPRLMPAVGGWYKKQWVMIGGAAALLVIGIMLPFLLISSKSDKLAKAESPGQTPPIAQPRVTKNPSPPVAIPNPQPVSAFTGELPPPAAGRWLVAGSNTSGRSDVFPTLTAALAKAAPGQTIQVFAPKLEEALVVNAQHEGVHIECGIPGQMIVWRPPEDASADVPLLRLESAGAAVIKGFVFDGADRLNRLIEITGLNSGLRLEDLYITDSGKRSIVLSGAVATKDRPITMERMRFTTVRDYAAAMHQKSAASIRPSAVECTGTGGPDPLSLMVRWCRFEGTFSEAVLIECPIDAAFEFNRFYTLKLEERPSTTQFIKAVSLRNVSTTWHEHVSLVNNTMGNFTQLLRTETKKAESLSERTDFRFLVKNNLVLGAPADSFVFAQNGWMPGVAKPLFEGSGGNVCRPGTVMFAKQLPDSVVPRKQIAFGNLDLTSATDQFLRYLKSGDTAELLTVGMDGGPVGVPPLD